MRDAVSDSGRLFKCRQQTDEGHGRADRRIKISKMKVDPAMYMKTKYNDKLSCVNKAKRGAIST